MPKHRLSRRAALAIGLSMPFLSTRAKADFAGHSADPGKAER